MTLNVIHERLQDYAPRSKDDEENALKEICQEIALAGLARAKFFHSAAFQGGTCLRVAHGLRRFSEDLDFILLKPELQFDWEPFLKAISLEFRAFGLSIETINRSKAPMAVKRAFLKQDSFGLVLDLQYPRNRADMQRILIKLEIDTHPPQGSTFETHYLSFPYSFSIATQDLPSLFAGKCHALLCREYPKGRDWFDFLWYIQKNVSINLPLLESALKQQGPYQSKSLTVSHPWLLAELRKKIHGLDWNQVAKDVSRFVHADEAESLNLWRAEYFDYHVQKLEKRGAGPA